MKYYLITGERSGELHAANLIGALRQADPKAQIRGIGGNRTEAAGMQLYKNYQELAVMGYLEVLLQARKLLREIQDTWQDIESFQPDTLILVDFSGFNLRIAKLAKAAGIHVCYYISPKVWAWLPNRAKKIRDRVDRMLVILPFEQDFYKTYGLDVDYVGNPLLDAVGQFTPDPDFKIKYGIDTEKKVVALLPGSRKMELEYNLPRMLEVTRRFREIQFLVAEVDSLPSQVYDDALNDYPEVVRVPDDTYNLLAHADAAVVTSGTATLETALFNVPQLVVYRFSWVSYYIARWVATVKYISLVNLIAGKEVVKELIQGNYTIEKVKRELQQLLFDPKRKEQINQDYHQIRHVLGDHKPSVQAANLIVQYTSEALNKANLNG